VISLRSLALAAGITMAAGCGSTASPIAPAAGTQLIAPTVFRQLSQVVNATSNVLQFSWTSPESSFQLAIGSSPGSSNLLNTTVSTTSYSWISPRTGGAYYARVAAKRGDAIGPPSDELSLFVLDIRNVIDALFFRSGPMADSPATAATNPVAGVWADGTRLSVLVSNEATDTTRVNAQTFADQYATLTGGAVTASVSMTADLMHDADFRNFPEFTIGVRVLAGFCGAALGCVPVGSGPSPVGPNRSIVTLSQNGAFYLGATAHEMGHAYGMGHVAIPIAGRPEFRFMMSPAYVSDQMTDIEKLAITVARAGGIRAGTTRNEALGRDLVNPYAGALNNR
jgi:hypothetical protein